MNPVDVENAWVRACADAVAPAIAIPGTSEEVYSGPGTLIIIDCEDCRRSAGKYWRATVALVVDSPALAENPMPEHIAAVDAVIAWLNDKAAVDAKFPQLELSLNGFFFGGGGNLRVGERWQTRLEITAGMSTAV